MNQSLLVPIVCSVAGLANYILTLRLRAEVADLRAELTTARAKDREELMAFMNGSFMRAAVVEAKLEAIKACHG